MFQTTNQIIAAVIFQWQIAIRKAPPLHLKAAHLWHVHITRHVHVMYVSQHIKTPALSWTNVGKYDVIYFKYMQSIPTIFQQYIGKYDETHLHLYRNRQTGSQLVWTWYIQDPTTATDSGARFQLEDPSAWLYIDSCKLNVACPSNTSIAIAQQISTAWSVAPGHGWFIEPPFRGNLWQSRRNRYNMIQ